ncbi:YhgE/Pip family protein [Propionibacterium sp.]|uniref:YhgE/Pip family protein n=1 Tax=Propionibacterium sp. TaxID=1977903 RepID=UPI0039EB0AB8
MFAWTSHGTELKRFFRKPITRGAIAVLLLIPLLYGAMYVWAFWNPTERLSDLPVALVNEDVPVSSNGQTLAAGNQVVDKLIDQRPLGWRQVDAQTANDGVKTGKYYFSVTIPSTFSDDVASLGAGNPTAAELQVKYNDSNSFLATELGSNAMVQIRDVISQQISQQATKTLVVGLSSARSGFSDASDGAFVLEDGLKTAEDGSQQLSVGATQLDQGATALAQGAGQLAAGTASAANQVSALPAGASALNNGAQQLADGLGQLQARTPALVNGVSSLAAGTQQAASGASQLNGSQQQYVNGVKKASTGAQQIAAGTQNLDSQFSTLAGGVTTFANGATDYSTGATQFAQGAGDYSSGAAKWQSGAQTWMGSAQSATKALSDGATSLSDGLSTASTGASDVASGASSLAAGANDLAARTGKESDLYQGASQVAAGTGGLAGQLSSINDAATTAKGLIAAGDTQKAEAVLQAVMDSTGPGAQTDAQHLAAGASAVQNGIYSDDSAASTVNSGANQLSAGAGEVNTGAGRLGSGVADASAGAKKLADGANQLNSATGSSGELAQGLATLSGAQQKLSSGSGTLGDSAKKLGDGSTQLTSGAQQVVNGKTQIDQLNSGAQQLSGAFTATDPTQGLVSGATAIQAGTQQLSDGTTTLNDGAQQLNTGASSLGSGVDQLATGGKQVAAGTDQLNGQVPTLVSGIRQLDDGAQQISSSMQTLRTGTATLAGKAPSLTNGLDQAKSGSGTLGQKLKDGSSQIPDDNARTEQARSTAISSPVQLATSYLHKAASWGEFFAPFFIGLGLWVGALITWLLLRPLQSRALMTSVSGFRMAWGSLNSALTLAIGQVLIMLSVMHFGIGLDANNWIATILFTFLVAAAFFALQQMLQIAFGTAVGKVIIISVLMLQLASAGGTYPIQTEPGFFQAVSRWMPMTYVVNGLREAITGGIGPRFWTAVLVLVGIFAISLTLSSILASRKRMWNLSRLHPALSI